MNNSFPRLIDGMCATLRNEVLTRLDDDFARGQVFGIINLLNTFKVRADWSAGFLLQQIEAQRTALDSVLALSHGIATDTVVPPLPQGLEPMVTSIAELLASRDAGNQGIGDLLNWLDAVQTQIEPETRNQIESLLRNAMRAEVDIELKNSPKPLFAQMSSGRED
jgi:hypothetical protein